MILAATLAAVLLAAACTDKEVAVTDPLPPNISESYLKAHHLKGTVLLTVGVSAHGTVTSVTIKSSTVNDETFVRAAVQAARESTYSPATHNCQTVAGTYLFKVEVAPSHPQ